jgi:hypothetical protein
MSAGPWQMANRLRALGAEDAGGGGLELSQAQAAWAEPRWPRTRVPGPRFHSVSGGDWDDSGRDSWIVLATSSNVF